MGLLVVATGGTIASRVQPDGGVSVALTGAELLDTVAGLDRSDIDVVDVVHGPSWTLDLPTMASIAIAARDADASGVVITHGTDTLEETAFLTDLLAGPSTDAHAIVVTGAMRNAGQPDTDGPANLRDALALARRRAARGRGVLVALHGEIHEARWVTKTDTQSLDTFRSPPRGPVDVERDAPSPRPTLALPATDGPAVEPAVAIVRSYGGIDGTIVDWHLRRGARGLVIEGTGAGNVSGSLVPGIERAIAAGTPVVVTSRCATGPVAPVYGGPGGGHTLARIGVIAGGDLSAQKARVALAVALAVDSEVDAVRRWFAALVG